MKTTCIIKTVECDYKFIHSQTLNDYNFLSLQYLAILISRAIPYVTDITMRGHFVQYKDKINIPFWHGFCQYCLRTFIAQILNYQTKKHWMSFTNIGNI